MKKIFLLVVIIVLSVGGYYFYETKQNEANLKEAHKLFLGYNIKKKELRKTLLIDKTPETLKAINQDIANDFSEVIALNPNYSEAYLIRANARMKLNEVYAAMEDYDKAIATLHDTIKLNPNRRYDQARLYYIRGYYKFYRMGEFEEARNDFIKAISIYPEHKEAERHLVLANLRLNDNTTSK